MGFDPSNRSLKIWESIATPTPKMGSLGNVRVHSLTLFDNPRSMKCYSRASFLAHNLASPCLGVELKTRVAITLLSENVSFLKVYLEVYPFSLFCEEKKQDLKGCNKITFFKRGI
jgi:hypothetical protein